MGCLQVAIVRVERVNNRYAVVHKVQIPSATEVDMIYDGA